MEAQLNEANTYPAESYLSKYFSVLPRDNR